MKTWMLVVFLAAAPLLSADVMTSTTCGATGFTTVMDPHSCSVADGDAVATANVSLSLAAAPDSFSSFSISQSTETVPLSPFYSVGSTFASSQISVNETLFTIGTVRPGVVQVNVSGGNSGDRGRAEMFFSLGSIQVPCPYGSARAQSTCIIGDPPHFGPTYLVPSYGPSLQVEFAFTLGQPFTLSFSGDTGSGNNNGEFYQSSGVNDLQFQLRFFEADGVTPVAVQAAPEPGTIALFGAALGVLAVARRKPQR